MQLFTGQYSAGLEGPSVLLPGLGFEEADGEALPAWGDGVAADIGA
jgi:hypothetical protein